MKSSTSRRAPPVWAALRNEAEHLAQPEPSLASLLNAVIMRHNDLSRRAVLPARAQARRPGAAGHEPAGDLADEAYAADPYIVAAAEADLRAVFERDPACKGYVQPFLYFKGFLALQTHRVGHWLWSRGREAMAFYLQSRMSELFQVDIHPAAVIGKGAFFDHGTGIVIGETAVVGDDVSMLHGVTLGGTGAERGDRHPKIGKRRAAWRRRQGAGQYHRSATMRRSRPALWCLRPVPANCTAAGVPARLVNCPTCPEPARSMDHTLAEAVYDS